MFLNLSEGEAGLPSGYAQAADEDAADADADDAPTVVVECGAEGADLSPEEVPLAPGAPRVYRGPGDIVTRADREPKKAEAVEPAGDDLFELKDDAEATLPAAAPSPTARDDWADLPEGASVRVECRVRLVAFSERVDCELMPPRRGLVLKQTQRMPLGIGMEKRPRDLSTPRVRGRLWPAAAPRETVVEFAPRSGGAEPGYGLRDVLCSGLQDDDSSPRKIHVAAAASTRLRGMSSSRPRPRRDPRPRR